MPDAPLIAVPHWRAPTWERTRFYYDALEAAGASYSVVEADDLPAGTCGLLLTGGVDVNPRLYGEKRSPLTDKPNRKRDEHELRLLNRALERDIPVLCICRGHELLNVALGGSLVQHIEGDGHRWQEDGASGWHEVTIDGDGRLSDVYGRGSVLRVNSRHHQGVTEERLAPPLRTAARSTDGFVEAMESTEHRWVTGIQWHPERPEMQPESLAIFRAFTAACV
ncbi:MAG TPA: gamma-glutamyl-gamma-aminobutyrate hydrolase family protein [Dehalococcoidia bacterium]|nr:gamma-glutamyl-gamma-aminobutyrate hydrolase family protein [Dehalococcoidia bacterium]